MTYKELTKNITIFIEPLETSGCYMARIRGCTPIGERLHFDIETSGCYTQEVLEATLNAELEEILSCKYDYEIDKNIDEDDLLYDGGNFNESN